MRHIELDQSGRTENLSEPSALAFANGQSASILIPASEKQALNKVLKERYKELHAPDLRVFVAAIFLLLKDHVDEQMHITIDKEFDGKEGEIKAFLIQHIRRVAPKFPKENIVFTSIGKKSRAHYLAYGIYKRKQQPDKIITARDILSVL